MAPTRNDEERPGAMAFSPDGKLLAAIEGAFVHLWDARTGKEMRTLRAKRERDPQSLSFSPDSRRVAVSTVGQFSIWDVETGYLLLDVIARDSSVNRLVWARDGRRIFLCGGRKEAKIEIYDSDVPPPEAKP